jgi:hypothetical protein
VLPDQIYVLRWPFDRLGANGHLFPCSASAPREIYVLHWPFDGLRANGLL